MSRSETARAICMLATSVVRSPSAVGRAADGSSGSRLAAITSMMDGIADGVAAPADLVEQRSAGATIAGIVAMLRRQILMHELLKRSPTGGQCGKDRSLGTQLFGHHLGDEVVLRLEVGVERAIGQPRIGHQGSDTGTVDAVPLQTTPGGLDDPLPGLGRVLCVVSRHYGHLPSSLSQPA